eukprot:jgi/Botrbrau1/18303/Bobra.0179s0032.1
MVKVAVKWQKEIFKDLEVDTTQPPLVFKMQLYTLTGVPPERQKILVKGGQLKDDGDWAKVALKEGQTLMMMGTAEVIPMAPEVAPIFMEDIPEDEQDVLGLKKYGAGLKNLGNTCYMNATLQVLYRVPELKDALRDYTITGDQGGNDENFTRAAKDLFEELDRSATAVAPFRFLFHLRNINPQFAQQGQGGQYMQQDADECWTQTLYTFRQQLKGKSVGDLPTIDKVFAVGLHTKLTCEETGETKLEDTTATELNCTINIDVNQLAEGIRVYLNSDREEKSEITGTEVVFKGSSQITSLPPYLAVKLVRFYYKKDVQQKAKILRKVAFPMTLDCFEFCTEEYKKQLEGPRTAWDDAQERQLAKARTAASSSNGTAEKEPEPSSEPESMDSGEITGRYNLVAVLTHKGRSADSGHYVSWVKQLDGTWIQFDDEELIVRKEDEIPSLSGGGDWHMAYVLLYEAERVP